MKPKVAPKFASFIGQRITELWPRSPRQLAKTAHIHPGVLSRLCKNGQGREEHICAVLKALNLKPYHIIAALADRRSELTENPASEIWGGFRHRLKDEADYLAELCPISSDNAARCAYAGIAIKDFIKAAQNIGLHHIRDLERFTTKQAMLFFDQLSQSYEKSKVVSLLQETSTPIPKNIFLLDTLSKEDASDYRKLYHCRGKLFFGIPHLVIGHYDFDEDGIIYNHRNTGSMEFLYSLSGSFEITYAGHRYPLWLRPGGMVYVYAANKKHEIQLKETPTGQLLLIRYYPGNRAVKPGRKHQRHKV